SPSSRAGCRSGSRGGGDRCKDAGVPAMKASALERPSIEAAHERGRHYRYYDLFLGGFVTLLLCSNLIGPGKSVMVRAALVATPLVFGAGNLFFPISYIFGDVLTEVYGYARARKVIWAGFGAMIFATLMSQVVIRMPVNPAEPFNAIIQPALEVCFGN